MNLNDFIFGLSWIFVLNAPSVVFSEGQIRRLELSELSVKKTQSIKIYKKNYDIEIRILPDIFNQEVKGAKTEYDLNVLTPDCNYSAGAKPKITKLADKVHWKLTIQTKYGVGFRPETRSGYGRGTTKEDIAVGNTRLGFHEYCHRQDYIRYVKERGLSDLGIKIGISFDKYRKLSSQKALDKVIEQLTQKMDVYSSELTDNVGYVTRDIYLKNKGGNQ